MTKNNVLFSLAVKFAERHIIATSSKMSIHISKEVSPISHYITFMPSASKNQRSIGSQQLNQHSPRWSASKTSNAYTTAAVDWRCTRLIDENSVCRVGHRTVNIRSRWWRYQQMCVVVVRDPSTCENYTRAAWVTKPFKRFTAQSPSSCRPMHRALGQVLRCTATNPQRIDALSFFGRGKSKVVWFLCAGSAVVQWAVSCCRWKTV